MLYKAPEEFTSQLNQMFDGRYRLRWSEKRGEFHLEQKVATGQVMQPPPIDPDAPDHYDTYSDEWVRARDGYFYIMTIRNGDRMPCPICHLTVPVPVLETKEGHCENCRLHGRDGKYLAAFYPLNHILLEKIRDIDPYMDHAHQHGRFMKQRDIERRERQRQQELDDADYNVIFNKNQVENNPISGYGPKSARRDGEVLTY